MRTLFFCLTALWPWALASQHVNEKTITAPEVVITEIFADPDPGFGLPPAEFVEVYNRSTVPVDLTGWVLFDGSSKSLPAKVLLPGGYLVICANADTVLFGPFGNVAGVSSLSLTNTGEKVSIRNQQGFASDSVVYSDTWFGTSFKKDGGWSLERIDNHFLCFDRANWKPSVNPLGGTPGAENSVKGIFTDTVPPRLLRTFCVNPNQVQLVFSEPLSADEATDVNHFMFLNGPGILQAEFADATLTGIVLELDSPLQPNQIYWLKAEGVPDCKGNTLWQPAWAKTGLSASAMQGDVVLNEILFNPFSGGYDFIEVFNRGQRIINLEHFSIAKLNPVTTEPEEMVQIAAEPLILFPGEYMCLTENPDIVAAHYPSSFPFGFHRMIGLPSMNVDEGFVAIVSNQAVHDAFHYFESYHFELLENRKGISLEKIHPLRESQHADSWHSASPDRGGATPGLMNSQFQETNMGVSDIQVYPEIFSPDFDGYEDVITFLVRGAEPGTMCKIQIMNSSGQIIYSAPVFLSGTNDAYTWDGIGSRGLLSDPGIYVALVTLYRLHGHRQQFKLPFVLAIKL